MGLSRKGEGRRLAHGAPPVLGTVLGSFLLQKVAFGFMHEQTGAEGSSMCPGTAERGWWHHPLPDLTGLPLFVPRM